MPSLDELPTPVAEFRYSKPQGRDAAESIYLFDQEAAKAGLVYYAEYSTGPSRWYAFHIWVNEIHRETVAAILGRLNPPYRERMNNVSGWWRTIEPTRLSKSHKGYPWIFAVYSESATERDDGLRYTAFLFRNEDRTTFGILEWLGNAVVIPNLEDLAHRVVKDGMFRGTLVSDDPDLPLLWKRR